MMDVSDTMTSCSGWFFREPVHGCDLPDADLIHIFFIGISIGISEILILYRSGVRSYFGAGIKKVKGRGGGLTSVSAGSLGVLLN
jgi:hypothetical protein